MLNIVEDGKRSHNNDVDSDLYEIELKQEEE